MEPDPEVTNFVQCFHHLEGTTIGAKKRSLSMLLRSIPENHNELLATLAPRNYLESLLRLKILLKLDRSFELIEILKSGDECLTYKLLKNKGFCRTLVLLTEGKSLDMDSILPNMSLVSRKRLLNQFAVYGNDLDGFYDQVLERYGTQTALHLLVGCSTSKIVKLLADHKPVLKLMHWKVLHEKHPTIFATYIRERRPDEAVFKYLSHSNIELFLQLADTFNTLPAGLGKRTTNRLVKHYTIKVIANASKWYKDLHLKTVVEGLRENFREFFFACFPSVIDRFEYSPAGYRVWGSKLGKMYYAYLSTGISEVYKKVLIDFPDLVNAEMMELMGVEDRQKWVEIKGNELEQFLGINDSVPLLKQKIKVTSSIKSRENLLGLLLETCKINKDLDALADALDYVCIRHRNDDALAETLCKIIQYFDLSQLEHRHWNSIHKIMDILEVKGAKTYINCQLSLKYLEFLFNRNAFTDEDILEHLKRTQDDQWRYKTSNKKLKKTLLIKSIEFMPKLISDHTNPYFLDLELMHHLIKWNLSNSNELISFWEYQNRRLYHSLEKLIQLAKTADEFISEFRQLDSVLEYFICHVEKLDQIRKELIIQYFELGFRHYNLKMDFYLLRRQVESIGTHLYKFLDHLIQSYNPDLHILNLMKQYSHLTIPQRAIAYCCEKLQEQQHEQKIFLILAILMPVDDFLNFISSRQLTEKEAEGVVSSLKYTYGSATLPALINYCRGDFLRSALESLYYLFYHTPEKQLPSVIHDLASEAVSARKHAIFLVCVVGSTKEVEALVLQFIEKETDVSVQKHLFTALLKYFVQNSSPRFWELLKECIIKLNPHDRESFALLINLPKIPFEYQSDYVITAWKILHQEKDKLKLLSRVSGNLIPKLSLDFIEEVISQYFLTGANINNFVVEAVLKGSHPESLLDIVFKTAMKREGKVAFFEFVRLFAEEAVNNEQSWDVISAFSQRWHALHGCTEAIEEHVKLSLSCFYIDAKKDLIVFSALVGGFFSSLIESYGLIVADVFAPLLSESLRSFFNCYSEVCSDYLRFCLNLMQHGDNIAFKILVIKLLPNEAPRNEDVKSVFTEIVELLKATPNEAIQMLLNLYTKNMK